MDSRIEAEVSKEQIQTLYLKAPVAFLASVLNGAVLVGVLWERVSRSALVAWYGAVLLSVVWRAMEVRAFRRQRAQEALDIPAWTRRWMLGIAISGAIWGSCSVFLYPPSSLPGQTFVLMLVAGMVAGASASTSSHFPSFLAFTGLCLPPLVTRLAAERDLTHVGMAVLTLSFGVGMSLVSRAGGSVLAESIRMRLRNEALVERLKLAQEEQAKLTQELETRVEQRTAQLAQSIARRDEFVSVVAHELRTPLTSLKLNQALLERQVAASGEAGSQLSKDLGKVTLSLRRQVVRLNRLVDDLIDLNRIVAGRLRYDRKGLDVSEVVSSAMEQIAAQFQAAGVSLRVENVNGVRAEWDGYRVEQAIINLLSNALKYGRGRPVDVTATVDGRDVLIAVRDDGPGVRPEDRERIFRAFERGSPDPGTTGIGLGLYIADRIVSDHGGTIRLETELGRGSRFVIRLPLAPSASS